MVQEEGRRNPKRVFPLPKIGTLIMSKIHILIEMENGLKYRCFMLQPDALRRGEATCLQLALSSFASMKTSFNLVNPRVVLAECSPFSLANLRPSLSSVFSFTSEKLSLHLGELLRLDEAVLLGKFCFLALFFLFFACFTFYSYKT